MYVLINGAFGIGKSAVARELRTLLPGSVIFDPEWPGFAFGACRSDECPTSSASRPGAG